MELRHNWSTWESITARLEREGKLDEIDILITTVVRRQGLYNELLMLSDTIEELVVLSHYSGYGLGYRQGYKDGVAARQVPEYLT